MERLFISTTRTVSPYFSPKRAMAPIFLASSRGISVAVTGLASRIISLTSCSVFFSSSSLMAEKWEKSKRQISSST